MYLMIKNKHDQYRGEYFTKMLLLEKWVCKKNLVRILSEKLEWI